MKFSVVIVNYNTKHALRAALRSIQVAGTASGCFCEIIVVDNASADGSAAMVTTEFPAAILLTNEENRGFAAAANQGAKRASGDVILFLNSDAELSADFLMAAEKALAAQSGLAIVAPALHDSAGVAERQSHGRFPTLARTLFRRIAPRPTDDPAAVDWVSGAALAIRRPIFEELGGFDERFFMYFEDVDLCWRAKQTGYAVRFLPDVAILHHRGASLRIDTVRTDLYKRSQLAFFRKHYGRLPAALIGFLRRFR